MGQGWLKGTADMEAPGTGLVGMRRKLYMYSMLYRSEDALKKWYSGTDLGIITLFTLERFKDFWKDTTESPRQFVVWIGFILHVTYGC